MIEKYLIWKRMEDDLKRIIEDRESEMFINVELLKFVENELSKCPTPTMLKEEEKSIKSATS